MSFELTRQVYVGLRRDDLSEQETCRTALATAAELADAGDALALGLACVTAVTDERGRRPAPLLSAADS
jgi:hypothetical protein